MVGLLQRYCYFLRWHLPFELACSFKFSSVHGNQSNSTTRPKESEHIILPAHSHRMEPLFEAMKTSITINVPAFLVGKIIGKGGKKVKEIRKSSGVFRIDVSEHTKRGSKAVTIAGPTKASCEVARQAIASIISETSKSASKYSQEGQAELRASKIKHKTSTTLPHVAFVVARFQT